jgi:hypothetical protein
MKKQRLFISMFFLFLLLKASSQEIQITPPKLEFIDNNLSIQYDLLSTKPTDKFYIWIEVEKSNGEKINIKSLSGDIGADVTPGRNKKIIWNPEKDSIFIDENIFVEIKAEKYKKSFNKGKMILLSTVFPGWGQTKIYKGKPWWLTGAVFYGTMTAGIIFHQNYLKNYDSYSIETDPVKRNKVLQQAQDQLNYSNALIYSAATAWAANILWVALIPNRYKPLQHLNFSLNLTPSNNGIILGYNF